MKRLAAIALIEKWLADESGYDERTWPKLKKQIEKRRLSSRHRFRGVSLAALGLFACGCLLAGGCVDAEQVTAWSQAAKESVAAAKEANLKAEARFQYRPFRFSLDQAFTGDLGIEADMTVSADPGQVSEKDLYVLALEAVRRCSKETVE